MTRTETFALTAIAYLQPVTRGEISRLAGREISRDIIASLKRHGLIDGAIRAPQPGAPFAYVTTRKFLEAFGFASLRDLPDLERLKAEGLLREGRGRTISTARLGWRMPVTTTRCSRASVKNWTQLVASSLLCSPSRTRTQSSTRAARKPSARIGGSCAEQGAERETTVDQALIRGLVTAFRVFVSGLSSV